MEGELIARLRQRLRPNGRVLSTIGDDAAVLDATGLAQCVLTVDLLTEGVDFLLDQVDADRVGRKALAVNLSDLAAMASEPVAAVVALALPRQGGMDLAEALYDGICPLADEFKLPIAGGDTNSWDGGLVISITLLGRATERGVLRRAGACPDDAILVTGAFGGSILGKQFDFQPRLAEALRLHRCYDLRAGIDVSDGLSKDLDQMARQSGLGAEIRLTDVPIADDAHRLASQLADGSTPLDHALADGEDFELILAVPPAEAERLLADQPLDIPLTRIGRFTKTPGLWHATPDGRRALPPRGYRHEF